MKIEFEAKFYPINKISFRKKLKALGAKLIFPEKLFYRTIFDNLANPGLPCDYIRVRTGEADIAELSLKIHAHEDGKVSDQKELMVGVDGFEATVEILKTLGFKPSQYQETKRERWKLDGAEITLDTWPGLEPYTEIEAKSEKKVKAVAEKFGFDWEKKIITGPRDIFMKVYGLTKDKAIEKLAYLTFKNNPFSTLTEKETGDRVKP
ncbi:MAG: class IV adenylate cyclase [bacterium]|nr:class IV adenylate cyclase [bacterium]